MNASSLAFVTASKYNFDKSDSSYHQAEDALSLFYRTDEKLNNITQGKPINSNRYEFLYFLHYAAIGRNFLVKNPRKGFLLCRKTKTIYLPQQYQF